MFDRCRGLQDWAKILKAWPKPAILCLTSLAFLAVDLAGLAAMVLVGPEGAFRLILQKLYVATIAPVHVLRIIPVLEFLGVIPCFGNSIIGSFNGLRDAAGTYARNFRTGIMRNT